MKSIVLALTVALFVSGCAGFGKKMKSFLNGKDEQTSVQKSKAASVKFSETPELRPVEGEKLYRRVNKEIFEKDGLLNEDSGSLWVMEGQGSYLFSQNLMRVSGDVVNISLDGVPRSSLEKKVDIIKTLLERSRRTRVVAAAASTPAQAQADPNAPAAPPGDSANQQQQGAQGQVAGPTADEKADAEDEKKSTFDVTSVPSRIVEKTPDGSYRIKGSQSFMIGRREYKVIATGVVRPADIKNDSIEASRLVDSKFDIVAIRKESK